MSAVDKRELYGQTVPLHGLALLLPKIALLEIQGLDCVTTTQQGPVWLLGFGTWREHELPVVSLEAMTGAHAPARSRRMRVAVLNSFGNHLANGLFMLVTQGYPQLTALNRQAFQQRPPAPQDRNVALARVKLANTDAIIPDLEGIERQISEAVAGISAATGSASEGQAARR